MIIQCSSCARKFIVKDEDIPKNGRTVQCGYCSITWHQMPTSTKVKNIKKEKPIKPSPAADESPSVENLRASDGKTYKFLGSQWAELLPSGKTGLFARKKIAKELDEITGRKKVTTIRKKRKKIEDVDPSLESMDNQKRLPDIYKPNQGLGFLVTYFVLPGFLQRLLLRFVRIVEPVFSRMLPQYAYMVCVAVIKKKTE